MQPPGHSSNFCADVVLTLELEKPGSTLQRFKAPAPLHCPHPDFCIPTVLVQGPAAAAAAGIHPGAGCGAHARVTKQ